MKQRTISEYGRTKRFNANPRSTQAIKVARQWIQNHLDYNPNRIGWIEVQWRGAYWLVSCRSRLYGVQAPTATTDNTIRVYPNDRE